MKHQSESRSTTDPLRAAGITAWLACSLFAACAVNAQERDAAEHRGCPSCPTMIAVPAGSFEMGAPVSEPQSSYAERPVHTVTVPGFWMSETAITFGQWDACVSAGGCSHVPDDQGWGRGSRPVVDVNWHDAREYVQWLSEQTGQTYRLPTEAEWEYAARAGSTTRYTTGNCIDTSQANFQGGAPAPGCPGGLYREQTSPVETFAPNAWGLYEMHGNVWEWVEDCWHGNYDGAPDDGSAWTGSGQCDAAVLRGGSWSMGGRSIRSATRAYDQKTVRNRYRGFRVVRAD